MATPADLSGRFERWAASKVGDTITAVVSEEVPVADDPV
jgi:hypothetical protein